MTKMEMILKVIPKSEREATRAYFETLSDEKKELFMMEFTFDNNSHTDTKEIENMQDDFRMICGYSEKEAAKATQRVLEYELEN